jgi:DNA-binding XRE family transcriptional regulator
MTQSLTTFTTPSGEEMVVLPRAEYDRLIAAPPTEADEDAGVARIVAATSAAITRGEDVAIPEEVWDAIETGANPVVAIRKWRDVTQMYLAHKSGISQGYLSQVEAGARRPTVEVLSQLSDVLEVPIEVLIAKGPG